jgi:tRNA pseudouridine55 synthase
VSRRGGPAGPDGLAVVDKPAGWTSHDVVAKSRGLLGTRKVGHSGTLDPDATGVLLLGVGRVTRLLRFATALPKTYTATIVLGVETDTLDASGTVTAEHDMTGVTAAEVVAAAASLTGDILQVPPMVSAVKVDGKRLHELARAGVEVERQPRPVTVYRFEVAPVDGEPLRWRAAVECSSGTYVRTLAADIGAALGGGAHLTDLRRTAVGPFEEQEAVALEQLAPERLLTPADALRWMPVVVADEATVVDVAHGRVLPARQLLAGVGNAAATMGAATMGAATMGAATTTAAGATTGPWRVVDATGRLLAVYEAHGADRVKPSVVLATAS